MLDLKIFIGSTPKTGNTWLQALLAAVYELPLVSPATRFDAAQFDGFGSRWIGHQHLSPSAELLDWAACNHAVLLTTLRHPGDVLISFYHHIRNYHQNGSDYGPGISLLVKDPGDYGLRVVSYVREFFFLHLNISLNWLHSGKSHIVRYEDVWRDPVTTLIQLTEMIQPVSLERIERALEQTSINLMRKVAGRNATFFRRGDIGGWRNDLPTQVLDVFRTCDPYPAQFAALGYTLDPHAALIDAPARPRPLKSPFRDLDRFDNGVPIPALAVQLYLSFETSEAAGRWPNVAGTHAPDSFYAWLNAPAGDDPNYPGALPIITNLSAYVHQTREDLCGTFPDLYGAQRVDWAFWFLRYAATEYELSSAFIAVVQESLLAWGLLISEKDPLRDDSAPPITNLAAYFHQSRPDLQAVYPDVYGVDRLNYLLWLFRWSDQEKGLEPIFVNALLENFLAWANAPDTIDPQPHAALRMTKLAALAYHSRAEPQQLFPDAYGEHRAQYLMWFVENYAWIVGAVKPIVNALAQRAERGASAQAPVRE